MKKIKIKINNTYIANSNKKLLFTPMRNLLLLDKKEHFLAQTLMLRKKILHILASYIFAL